MGEKAATRRMQMLRVARRKEKEERRTRGQRLTKVSRIKQKPGTRWGTEKARTRRMRMLRVARRTEKLRTRWRTEMRMGTRRIWIGFLARRMEKARIARVARRK